MPFLRPCYLSSLQAPGGIAFSDVTASAGIRFKHVNGAFGKKYMPDAMGSGCAFLDYDGDGHQDLFWSTPAPCR